MARNPLMQRDSLDGKLSKIDHAAFSFFMCLGLFCFLMAADLIMIRPAVSDFLISLEISTVWGWLFQALMIFWLLVLQGVRHVPAQSVALVKNIWSERYLQCGLGPGLQFSSRILFQLEFLDGTEKTISIPTIDAEFRRNGSTDTAQITDSELVFELADSVLFNVLRLPLKKVFEQISQRLLDRFKSRLSSVIQSNDVSRDAFVSQKQVLAEELAIQLSQDVMMYGAVVTQVILGDMNLSSGSISAAQEEERTERLTAAEIKKNKAFVAEGWLSACQSFGIDASRVPSRETLFYLGFRVNELRSKWNKTTALKLFQDISQYAQILLSVETQQVMAQLHDAMPPEEMLPLFDEGILHLQKRYENISEEARNVTQDMSKSVRTREIFDREGGAGTDLLLAGRRDLFDDDPSRGGGKGGSRGGRNKKRNR